MKWSKYFFLIVMLLTSITIRGQYNPTNPAEPGITYTLTLISTPQKGGSFNINSITRYTAGTSVRLRAYNNSNYTFLGWEEKGEVISTSPEMEYIMPSRASTLTARFEYNPNNPSEPDIIKKPQYCAIYLDVSPKNSGSLNINSGNKYEVGSSISLQAYNNSNFSFKNWTEDGVVLSTSPSFKYTIKEKDAHIVANFEYTPNNPAEPSVPKLSHKLFLQCNPSEAGYFNVSSGNSYQEGTAVNLQAYANQYYTFQNWSVNGEIISNEYTLSYVMPSNDITLTANYTYNYDPNNPTEPGESDPHDALYGMTENAIRGQRILYPIFLENSLQEAKGFAVDVKIPDGFIANKDEIILSGRATDHKLTVTDLGENNYRLSVLGSEPLSENNGKVLDIPINIPDTAAMGITYPVLLTHGVLMGLDESQKPISTRNGGILIEKKAEDGLYARFSFDKYQNRVKFTNLSSDKATNYEWDFGDGTKSTENSPMHIFAQSGMYTVKLTAYGKTGMDVAEMAVLINEESNWKAQGTYYLNSNPNGVRYFSSLNELFDMLKNSTINGDLHIAVESDQTFLYDLSTENQTTLTDICQNLLAGNYLLSFEKEGSGNSPVVQFGKDMESYNPSLVTSLQALGKKLNFQNVEFRMWNVALDFAKLTQDTIQQVYSETASIETNFSGISPDLTFFWSLENPPTEENISGFQTEGNGNIPAMTLVNDTENEYVLSYLVKAQYQGKDFLSFNYKIKITPILKGEFTDFMPANGATVSDTEIILAWNKIGHAVYDVYLWDENSAAPTTPIIANLNDTCYTISSLCQYGNCYHWMIKAKSSYQELVSDTLSFCIGKRQLTDDLYTVNLPEDITYDGQKHTAEFTGEPGIGEVTFFYTIHGEAETLPDAPINAGEYDVYMEIAESELFFGMEKAFIGTFTIYQFDEKEWQQLQILATELTQYGWKEPWDLNLGITAVSSFSGLDIKQGHIVGLNLEEQNLTGLFPASILNFPDLTHINLSKNNLSGDLPAYFTELKKQEPTLTANITYLDISKNKYTGNVGLLSQSCPELTYLDASQNCFEEVYPMISNKITDLNLKGQQIDRVIDLDIQHADPEELMQKIPSILLYDHAQQTFKKDINILCTLGNPKTFNKENASDWAMQISYKNGVFSIPYVSEQNEYYGSSGDTLNVMVLDSISEPEGSTFKIRLFFEQGDANFIHGVEASDLQATILYVFGEYEDKPFNFTAANTYEDQIINVQDVVCTTNILLSDTQQISDVYRSKQKTKQNEYSETDAILYIQNGKIILNSKKPVAAIQIKAEGAVEWNIEKYGMQQSTKQNNLVGYSLTGVTLPAGENIIGFCLSDAYIREASLSDSNANAISVGIKENTGISGSDVSLEDCLNPQIYDLSGRKMNSLRKGINIVKKNGRFIKITK